MRKQTFVVMLALSFATSVHCQMTKSSEKQSPWDESSLISTHSYTFKHASVSYDLLRKKDSANKEFWRFGSNIGRFTASFLSMALHGGGSLGEPGKTWMARSEDGRTFGEAEFPVVCKGEKRGFLSLRMVELKDHPQWIFFRINASGGSKLASFSLAARAQPQSAVMGGTISRLFLAWPGGSCPSGEMPPWNKQKPEFNALAFFARGQREGSLSDMLVFDPQEIASIYLQRWDGVGILVFNVSEAPEYVFALGFNDMEDSEKVAIPNFMKNGRQTISETMKKINWEAPKADLGQVGKSLAELAEMLKEYPDAEIQKEFDRLSAEVKTLKTDDLSGADKIKEEARKLSEKIAEQALKTNEYN